MSFVVSYFGTMGRLHRMVTGQGVYLEVTLATMCCCMGTTPVGIPAWNGAL